MQRLTGALLYISTRTRPDIGKAVHMLSTIAHNPTQKHIRLAKDIIYYLYQTKTVKLRYKSFAQPAAAPSTDC